MRVKTTVDGETVTNVHKTATATDGSTASAYATTSAGVDMTQTGTEGGTTTATMSEGTASAEPVATEQSSALRTVLTSIQNILKQYVALLF